MPEKFHCYGENSFTFLLFQALRRTEIFPQGRFRHLLSQLLQFGNGNHFNLDISQIEEPEIWLFPNFGRRHGFGEPDALVLFGDYSFWFEVETAVNLRTGCPALERSLLQMARFHFFYQALKKGAEDQKDYRSASQGDYGANYQQQWPCKIRNSPGERSPSAASNQAPASDTETALRITI